MAQRTQVIYSDDIDGTKAEGTVTFGFDGKTFEIDLSKKNQAKLRKTFAPYMEHARRAHFPRQRDSKAKAVRTKESRERNSDIRVWAKIKGIKISDRGRMPESVAEQYEREVGH